MSYFPDNGKKKFLIASCQNHKNLWSLRCSKTQGYSTIPNIPKSQMSRTEILEEASKKKCICGGKWFQCTTQVPVNNKIHPFEFVDCFRNLLIIGRGKCRNIFIPNCGKTFLLKPLEDIFLIFSMIDTTVG